MTDQTSNNPTEGVATTPAQELESATTPPSSITKKDFDDFKSEMRQELSKYYQGSQSRQDKFTAKMQQKMEAFESNAKAYGVQLTDAERQAYQSQAKFEILNQTASTGQPYVYQPGQAAPMGLSEQEFISGVEAAATAIFKANNVEIKRGDPEDAIIAAAEEKSPDEYLKAVQAAIDAKKARTGASPAAQPSPHPATNFSPGLVKGTPQSNPIANITDRDELWKMSFGKGS